MLLAPFDPADASIVSSWAPSIGEVRLWCSRGEAPVPAAVVGGWGRQDGVLPFVLLEAGRPVAYGELWIDLGEEEVELARLIVDPSQRGRGIGRRLASSLAVRASQIYPRVFARVYPENVAAQRCYLGAGFIRVSAADEQRWNGQQPVPYVWMQYGGQSRSTSSSANS